MASIENPYQRLPSIHTPDQYYGSGKAVRFALEQTSGASPHSIEFSGLPGMGKSALLRYLARPDGALHMHSDWLQEPFNRQPYRLFPLLVEFRLLPTGTHPFVYLYTRLQEEYPTYRQRIQPQMEDDLPRLSGSAPEKAEAAVDQLERDLRQLKDRGIRPVLLLDDFHLAFDPQHMTRAQTTRLRPFQSFAAFVLTTERPLHLVNADAAGSPFWQTLPIWHLGGLDRSEALALIQQPAQSAGHPFPPGDIDFVLDYADGHVFLLMQAGMALWDTRARGGLLGQPNQALSGELLSVLRGRLQEDLGRSFRTYWECLEPNECDALGALVHGQPLAESGYRALATLEHKGLVRYDTRSDRFTLFSPLFESFVAAMPGKVEAVHGLRLTGLEASLYEYLRKSPGRVHTYEELWHSVWGQSPDRTPAPELRRRIHVTASRLRKMLREEGRGEDVTSVRKQGYRFSIREAQPRRRGY